MLAALLVLTACSKGPEADLQYIKQARSLAAEWATINEQSAKRQLTDIYAATMHQWIRRQLESASQSLTEPHSAYAAEIDALLDLPDDAPPTALHAYGERLKQFETSLESA